MRERNWAIIIIIGVVLTVTAIGYGIDENNKNFKVKLWQQNGTVIRTDNNFWGSYVIIDGDNGKRYAESCTTCMVGDRVRLDMYENRSRWIDVRWVN